MSVFDHFVGLALKGLNRLIAGKAFVQKKSINVLDEKLEKNQMQREERINRNKTIVVHVDRW